MEPTYYFASSIVKHYGGPEKFLNFLLDSHPLGWLKSKNDSILRSEYLLVSYQEYRKKSMKNITKILNKRGDMHESDYLRSWS